MTTQDYIAIENQYGAHNYHPLDVVVQRAEGVWVYDARLRTSAGSALLSAGE